MFKPINGWTKESILNHIRTNFKGRSYVPSVGCLYRGPAERKCAAGMFIPDKLYSPEMENIPIGRVVGCRPKLKTYMPLENRGMYLLQLSHDGHKPKEFRSDKETLSSMLTWVEENVA